MHARCPYSGELFVPKRRNQRFANSKNRQNYHNEIAKKHRDMKSEIDKALFKNFLILTNEIKEGETKTIEKEILLRKGFNPNIFTHLDTLNGRLTRCIYQFYFVGGDNANNITISLPKK